MSGSMITLAMLGWPGPVLPMGLGWSRADEPWYSHGCRGKNSAAQRPMCGKRRRVKIKNRRNQR